VFEQGSWGYNSARARCPEAVSLLNKIKHRLFFYDIALDPLLPARWLHAVASLADCDAGLRATWIVAAAVEVFALFASCEPKHPQEAVTVINN
jgi:hypothetical protein